MGRIAILEGPDGSGKTTLAKKFEANGWRYRHDGVPPPERDNIAYYLEVLNEAIESKENTVFDRLWLGQRIYGPVARGVDNIGEEGQKLFMRLHASKDIVQYICLPMLLVAKRNYAAKIEDPHDYLKSMEKFEKVYHAYANWAYSWSAMSELYDYEQGLSAWPDNWILPTGTVGSPRAKYLFIGDTPNHPTIDVPFHAITGSSGYFNEALSNAGIKEKDLALSNAHQPNGKQHDIYEIVSSLPNLRHIFTMGNKAAEWLMRKAAIPVGQDTRIHNIPHPSYLKRFKGSNPWVMAKLIRQAIDG